MSRFPILSLLFTLLTLVPLALLDVSAVCPPSANLIALTDGVPYKTYISSGQSQYFEFSFTRTIYSTPLTIALTNYADDVPQLWLHPTIECPQAGTEDVIYRSGETDNFILLSSSQIRSSKYYITIAAQHNANYSIIAKYNAKTVISDGLPQAARVGKYAYEYLRADLGPLTPGNSKIRFFLTPIRGSAVFYVSPTVTEPRSYSPPSTTRSSYNSLIGQNELIWDLMDSNYPQPINGTFYIGVYGLSDGCRFQMIVHQFSTNALLVPGQPQMSQLQQSQYQYYTTRIDNPQCSLKVTITSFTGDPDLYTSSTLVRPSKNQYDRYSMSGYGHDSIIYTTTIPQHDYGIAVYAFSNTTYSIVCMVDCVGDNSTDFIYLLDGQPQAGALPVANTSAWYRISMADHKDLTISITVNSGDPDIYVSTIAPPSYSRANSSDRSSFDWSSESDGSDILVIHHLTEEGSNARTYCPKAGQEFCDYYIQVFAWSGCSYTIVATTSTSITQLRDGIAIHEDMTAGDYEYFTIPIDLHGETLTVTITDLGRGDPDLFINVAPDDAIIEPRMFPNMYNYTWASRIPGSESISIPATDPHYRSPARYLIAVHAWSSTSFTIVANFNRVPRLSPGIPQGGAVQRATWVYYEYIADESADESLSFMFTPVSGYANMYISTSGYPQLDPTFPNLDPYHPRLDADTYNYSSTYYQTPQRININHTTVHSCHQDQDQDENSCRYRIGIYGITRSTYTITVVAGSNIRLTNGVAVSGRLSDHEWSYYEIFVPNQGKPLDLSVVVTPYSGDPDLYLTNSTERPTTVRSTYRWFSTRFGGDTIDIDNCRPGTYVLGILCLGNCSYTVTSLIQSDDDDSLSLTNLIAGQPQNGLLLKNRWKYYAYDHTFTSNLTSEVSYTVTATYGDPDLYVTWDGRLPNRTTFNLYSQAAGTQTDVIRITNPVGSLHKIGIFSYATTQYTITAQVITKDIHTATRVIDGEIMHVNTTTLKVMRYYQIDNFNGKSVNVKLTTFTRFEIPEIYISAYYTFPNQINSTWKGIPFPEQGDNVFGYTIDTTDDKFQRSATYYIAVYASSYDFVISLGDIIYLEDGAVQEGIVQLGNYRYYTFQALNTSIEHQNIIITASPCTGSVALYMSQGIQPSKASHYWGDDRTVPGERMISITDGKFTNQYFYIGIYGQSDATYEVSVDTTNRAASSPDVTYALGSSEIIASSPSSSTIRLEFNAARSRIKSEQLTYNIYYTTRTDAVMFTDCGLRNKERVQFYTSMKGDVSTEQSIRKISVDVGGLQPSTAYQFSVVVSELDTSHTVYTPSGRVTTSGVAEESSSMSLKWLLGLGVPLFVLLAAFIIYLVIRNRRLTKELEIEMHDVPKGVLRRAVGRSAALEDDEKHARTSKPYSNLLTDGERSDEQPAEDADAYHPPDYARQL